MAWNFKIWCGSQEVAPQEPAFQSFLQICERRVVDLFFFPTERNSNDVTQSKEQTVTTVSPVRQRKRAMTHRIRQASRVWYNGLHCSFQEIELNFGK